MIEYRYMEIVIIKEKTLELHKIFSKLKKKTIVIVISLRMALLSECMKKSKNLMSNFNC